MRKDQSGSKKELSHAYNRDDEINDCWTRADEPLRSFHAGHAALAGLVSQPSALAAESNGTSSEETAAGAEQKIEKARDVY